jgi:hypothetical protein
VWRVPLSFSPLSFALDVHQMNLERSPPAMMMRSRVIGIPALLQLGTAMELAAGLIASPRGYT